MRRNVSGLSIREKRSRVGNLKRSLCIGGTLLSFLDFGGLASIILHRCIAKCLALCYSKRIIYISSNAGRSKRIYMQPHRGKSIAAGQISRTRS